MFIIDNISAPFRSLANSLGHALSIDANTIGDERFWEQLEQVRNLKRFLYRENVVIPEGDLPKIDLGPLGALRFHHFGHPPTEQQWVLLDAKQSALSHYLSARLRWKLELRDHRFFFLKLPCYFLLLSIISLAALLAENVLRDQVSAPVGQSLYAFAVIIWTVSLGGLGACAFLGTTLISETARVNALASEAKIEGRPESEFDLTDGGLMGSRIIVGVLFGFLLGLPVSAGSIVFVIDQIKAGNINALTLDAQFAQTIALTLLPFVVGFSTSLVLGIMDRFVTAIRTVFGITTK